MLRCTVPLCEKCRNYDWEHTGEIKEIFLEQGLSEPGHVWCKAKERPEDLRWKSCEGFEGYGHGRP